MKLLITGGAGFIGSALIRHLIKETEHQVLNVDKLTYAGNLLSLAIVEKNERYLFSQLDICDAENLEALILSYKPDAIIHLAAESHVDRSLTMPGDFIQTNIVGTYNLLQACLNYWQNLADDNKEAFRFIHVSTDEVFGDLDNPADFFNELTPYAPSSPYSASKASSDHLVRAWCRSYGLPCIVTNCSNNYGPYQFPEKFIPRMILNAINEQPLTVYGSGTQIRDWLYVDDHVKALVTVFEKGIVGNTYCIGGNNEKQNIEVVQYICDYLDNKRSPQNSYSKLITYVADRPGHDVRYAIDSTKIMSTLGWQPEETFTSGLSKTIDWYLNNFHWCSHIHQPK